MVTRPIAWWAESRLWLSLGEYVSAGLTWGRVLEVIRSMPDAGSASLNLRASRVELDGNIVVATFLTDPKALQICVDRIQARLDAELAEMANGKERG